MGFYSGDSPRQLAPKLSPSSPKPEIKCKMLAWSAPVRKEEQIEQREGSLYLPPAVQPLQRAVPLPPARHGGCFPYIYIYKYIHTRVRHTFLWVRVAPRQRRNRVHCAPGRESGAISPSFPVQGGDEISDGGERIPPPLVPGRSCVGGDAIVISASRASAGLKITP